MTVLAPAQARPWTPLLAGAEAARARQLIEEIACSLAPAAPDTELPLQGAAARALFFAYLAEAWPEHALAGAAHRHLEDAIAGLSRRQAAFGLHAGFAGVGWVTQHLVGRFDDEDEDDPLREIDDALLALTADPEATDDYELFLGLSGFGVYALERLGRPTGRRLLAQVVTRLAERAQRRGQHVVWPTPPERLDRDWRSLHPEGHVDCGAAHGMASVIAVLAGAAAADVEAACARPLLDGVISWLQSSARADAPSLLAHVVAPGRAPWPGRLSWCYGDAGLAPALVAAARTVGEPTWLALGRRAALHAAARVLDGGWQAGELTGSGLCHGSAGVALLLHRLWSELGEPSLAQAARVLYARTLELQPCGRVGGYRTALALPAGGREWVDDGSLLDGAAGVGLALLAASSPIEPAWDRLLVASLPPRRADSG